LQTKRNNRKRKKYDLRLVAVCDKALVFEDEIRLDTFGWKIGYMG